MQLEPLEDHVGRAPTIEEVLTRCAHIEDHLLLADKVKNEASERGVKTFLQHVTEHVLHDKIDLMRSAPNPINPPKCSLSHTGHNDLLYPGHVPRAIS